MTNSSQNLITLKHLNIILLSFATVYFLVGVKFGFLVSFAIFLFLTIAWLFAGQLLVRPVLTVVVMVVGTSLDVLGRIMGMPITIFHVGFILAIFVFLIRIFYSGSFVIRTTNFDRPLFIFLTLIAISLLYTPAREEGIINLLRVIALTLVMYLTINLTLKRSDIYLIAFTFIVSAFILSVFATKSIAVTPESLVQASIGFSKVFGRFGVTFENPNYFATYLMFALLIGSSIFLNGKIQLVYRIILLFMLILIGIAMIGTFSRAAWVATIPGLAIVVIYSKYKRQILIGGIVVFLIAFSILIQNAFFQSFVMRFSSLAQASTDPSSMTRVYLMIGGLRMLVNSFFLGVGFQGFPIYYEAFYKPPNQVLFDVVESHTLPIEISAELGLLGILAFSIIIIRYFKFGFRSIHIINNPLLRACQIGFVAAMIGFLTNSLLSPGSLESNLLWLGFGLVFAVKNVDESQPETKKI